MIIEFFKNFYYTYRAKNSIDSRFKTLCILSKLSLKSYLYKAKNNEVNSSISGFKFSAYSYQSILFLYREIFCSDDYFFTSENKSPIVIDCGANIGAATLYLKRLFPQANIVSFEANPNTYRLLEKNIAQNKISNVAIHNIALYDRNTFIPFYISNDMGTLIGSVHSDRGGKTQIRIEAKRLSEYTKSMSSIDLIKIDVEGAEINIINDLIETGELIKANQYIIEYHHNLNEENSKLSSFLAKFEERGYNYSIKANFLRIRSYQDILIHFYKGKT